jgi:predicted  nucleic acid-binding Zn-ribbon protein
MISLEQIRLLETRINKAVELIRSLKDENKTLRRAVNANQSRMRELEKLVGDFKSDQQEIEQCILRALENLDRLEEEVTDKKGRKEPAPARGESARERAASPAAEGEPKPEGISGSAAEEAATLPPGTAGGGPGEKELDIF